MGANTATSRGVTLAAPGGNNAKGAWTEIVASTSQPFGGILVGEQAAGDSVFTAGSALLDIGVGAAGSEAAIVSDIAYVVDNNEIFIPMGDRNYPVDIPLGARISARYASSSAAANPMDLILYGVPRQ